MGVGVRGHGGRLPTTPTVSEHTKQQGLKMKINLPVTNVETLLPENEFIYSRTDLKGVIEGW
jgi:hypothetical protein